MTLFNTVIAGPFSLVDFTQMWEHVPVVYVALIRSRIQDPVVYVALIHTTYAPCVAILRKHVDDMYVQEEEMSHSSGLNLHIPL